MISSDMEDKISERVEIENAIRQEYESDIKRYRSIINSFFESYKKYGFVSPQNNLELSLMVRLNHTI